jgi:predicted Fe-Mo cluster-binding NifX family protein
MNAALCRLFNRALCKYIGLKFCHFAILLSTKFSHFNHFFKVHSSATSAGMVFAPVFLMRIAIAHWIGRVSPVFDVSNRLLLIDIEDGREKRREDIKLTSDNPLERAQELSKLGTKILLCGAISNVMKMTLSGVGIKVFGFLCGDLEAVVGAFINGQLTDARFGMPGLREKRQRPRLSKRRRVKKPLLKA